MSWLILAALFVVTALVLLLTMLPALSEWRRRNDVVPLHIDSEDALDPPLLARSFVARLAEALVQDKMRLGRSKIAQGPTSGPWPLNAREYRERASPRVWHLPGNGVMPLGIGFDAEVAATGDLQSAERGVYRALWAGGRLLLASHTIVLRWAHGREVEIGSDCRLAGRVSADESITLGADVRFKLLHAPFVRVGGGRLPALQATPAVGNDKRPAAVEWNEVAHRGICDDDLDLGDNRPWRGDLVCLGDLSFGNGCVVDGDLKARGTLEIGAGCHLGGNLVAEGGIEIGPHCTVTGSVVSETEIVLGAGCVVGAPGRPATVAAPRIKLAPGVVVCGTLWASDTGGTQSPAPVEAPHDGLREAAGKDKRARRKDSPETDYDWAPSAPVAQSR